MTVDRSGATWLNAVPAILAVLAATDPEHPVPARLRFARSASAPLPPAVRRAFEERTGLPVVETYGMTEAGSQIAAGTLGAAVPGSVGRPVGVELRVVADDGTPAAVDAPGRVQIRGAGVITRYAGGPAAAGQEMLTADGWLETGDVGRVAADGSLFLLGRRDDVINRGGEKIFPGEVEDVLLGTGVLRQAVVVGLPDPVLGRVPVAVVVPRDPCALADDGARQALVATLEAAAERALERVRRPARFYVLAAVPGSSAGGLGKVSRRRVAEALQQPTVPVGS
jgi:acyl-CoA synthetase (AMP-forming)/AMP-acid ligase II